MLILPFKCCFLCSLGCSIYSFFVHNNIRLLLEIPSHCFDEVSLPIDNEISQVEGLEGLHQLRELVLDRNRVKVLAANSFIAQNVLLELHLAENRIRELNHLDPLTELRKLFLGMNKLQVFSFSTTGPLIGWIFIMYIFYFLIKLHIPISFETTLMSHTTRISGCDHQGHGKLWCSF